MEKCTICTIKEKETRSGKWRRLYYLEKNDKMYANHDYGGSIWIILWINWLEDLMQES